MSHPEVPTKRNFGWFAASLGTAAVLAAIAAWFIGNGSDDERARVDRAIVSDKGANAALQDDPAAVETTREASPSGSARDAAETSGRERSTATATSSDMLLTSRELSGTFEAILLAQPTPEEAAWMRARGYPTYDQWMDREQIDIELLERLAARGDLVGMAMLADRIRSTFPRRAEELLDKAILNGSVFAAALSSQHAAERINSAPPNLQSSLRRTALIPTQLAALLGDNRAAEALPNQIGLVPIGSGGFAAAVRIAFRRIDEINADRRRRGLPTLSVVARPGFAEWNERVWGKPPEKVEIEIDCNTNPQICDQLRSSDGTPLLDRL